MGTDKRKGFVLWFTGMPCSGKSTIAALVAKALAETGIGTETLDGDAVRSSLSSDLGFSREDRDRNLDRVIFVAGLLERNGVAVIASFVSPYRAKRREARARLENFIEVFVDCPREECEKRDVKGMYRLAREGKIPDFTGVDAEYEIPENPDITVNTMTETAAESCSRIIALISERGLAGSA